MIIDKDFIEKNGSKFNYRGVIYEKAVLIEYFEFDDLNYLDKNGDFKCTGFIDKGSCFQVKSVKEQLDELKNEFCEDSCYKFPISHQVLGDRLNMIISGLEDE